MVQQTPDTSIEGQQNEFRNETERIYKNWNHHKGNAKKATGKEIHRYTIQNLAVFKFRKKIINKTDVIAV